VSLVPLLLRELPRAPPGELRVIGV
jgi:hypothetical protein